MTSARDYNAIQLQAGHLTIDHITKLVEDWQLHHNTLALDGKAGPSTIAGIEAAMRPAPFLHCPLPVLADGRRAQVTSGFRPADRPTHLGLDWFYEWRTGDVPGFVGDRGAEGRNADGTPRWVVPMGVHAIAPADGVVLQVGPSPTGWFSWVGHGNGLRTGCFHLFGVVVQVGQHVKVGDRLGPVGDNPADLDGRHLHFELSPIDRYEPMDPTPFLLPG